MSDVHESLTDWRTLPVSTLAGHRAIVQLDEGTIIDGYLEYVPSKLRKELRGATEGICETLTVEGVFQPVITSDAVDDVTAEVMEADMPDTDTYAEPEAKDGE